jgi:hypothetical protein
MKNSKFILLFFTIVVVILSSCKKDDPEPVLEYKSPTIAEREVIEIPAGLVAKSDEGDFNATMAMAYMGIANGIGTYGSLFYLPSDIETNNANENQVGYFWTGGGFSYWMTFTEENDKYVWTYDWEFPGTPRYTYIRAEEAKDGKSGNWSIYDPEEDLYVWIYSWSLDAAGNYTATLELNDSDETSVFTVVDNVDGSGSFIYTIGGIQEANIQWAANGSGTYWILDGGSGSWTAN